MAGNLQVSGVDFDNYYISNSSFIGYNDTTLFAWGGNSGAYNSGQLGLGDTTNRSSPAQVGTGIIWSKVSINGTDPSHTLAIKTDGTLWSWGNNGWGQLASGGLTSRSSPVQVGVLTGWSSVFAGPTQASFAIKTNGTLWAWGGNQNGQLGLGDRTHRSSPVQIGALTTWSSIAPLWYATVALKTDGTLWAWGENDYGQLGQGNITKYSSPVQIGALTTWSSLFQSSFLSCFAIKTDGTLWSWGLNNYGQLGLGDTTSRSSPVQVGALTTWSSIAASWYSIVALKTDGTLWSWGYNDYGQLGLGDTTSRSSPVQVGALTSWSKIAGGHRHCVAIKTDGTLWAWGDNRFGPLGQGNTTSRSAPVQVGTLTNWSLISAGGYSVMAIKNGL